MKRIALTILCFFAFTLQIIAQNPAADLVIFNADVRTMDKAKPSAQAIAVKGEKIIAVGTNAQIKRLTNSDTKIIDAKSKLILPGFNDSHVHFFSVGVQFFFADLKYAKNSAEIIEKIKRHAKFLPKGTWITGGFQSDEINALKILPSKELIDAAAPDNPILLYLKGFQTVFVNTRALQLTGFDKFDEESKKSGIVRGSAVNEIRKVVPANVAGDKSAVLETATNYAASVGVTSIQDVQSDDISELLRGLERQGKLKNRVYDCVALGDWRKLAARKIKRATGDAMIRQGCLKYFSDGNQDLIGDLSENIISADKENLQVMTHAIGGTANDIVLTIYENVIKQNGAKDRRFRIEHAHNFRNQDLVRFAKTNTIASMQPYLFFDGSGEDTLLFRQMSAAKTPLAFGSDANIIDLNPLSGIYAAVFGGNGMTVEEAVRAYTLGSAYAEFQENNKGSITVGKLADFVILSENIFTINPDQIEKAKVLQTVMNGKIIYTAQ